MTNESASMACSNVRLWKLDTQKEWRNTSWRLWDERTEKDSVGFVDSEENKWVDFLKSWSKQGAVRHCQSNETSILWSQHEETRELPGERDNARNNARCTQVRKIMTTWMDNIETWTGLPVKSQSEWQRTEINGQSTSMVWPTRGSRTAEEQNNQTKTKLILIFYVIAWLLCVWSVYRCLWNVEHLCVLSAGLLCSVN